LGSWIVGVASVVLGFELGVALGLAPGIALEVVVTEVVSAAYALSLCCDEITDREDTKRAKRSARVLIACVIDERRDLC
jgi:hypothetical protein